MNKKNLIIVIVVAAAVLGYIIYAVINRPSAPAQNEEAQTDDTVASTTLDAVATTTVATSTKPATTAVKKTITQPGTASKGYTDALKTYAGYKFQFVNCRATPTSMVVKKGQRFLLDNRDNRSHKFAVGGRTYTVAGYGYAIVSSYQLGANNLTCDGGGSARVNVEP
ncbi:MAG: hypothetical protein PHD72_00500 [Patescibacteria group bacterium]|nr:hypothetical protein [Patescibacteria group bacterium]